ncbi:MAG: protein kinase, partial [Candidatus Obscuribacterales bacterium]|nr:protein kinase [Candidatus Obscuribacterales bacterium]
MAELIVKSQCRSQLRDSTEALLNLTFPVWGIVAPLMVAGMVIGLVGYHQSGQHDKAQEATAYIALAACVALGSLFLKRLIAHDMITVDKQGISLPRLMGMGVNLQSYLPWSNIERVRAIVSSDQPQHSRIEILKKKGGRVSLPLNKLEPDFVEQFILASSMWAPAQSDPSLEQLQNVLRIGSSSQAQASYTELWEEELSRRFCPTSYVPLEAGRVLRNSTLKVVNQLSSGGLSALYLCQLDASRLVVLKEAVVPEHSPENVREKAKEMFEREARLLMKLDHPGIVHVLDSFNEAERNYLLLEYINGVDLRQLVRQHGAQKESDVLEWALQIAAALKYLHEREQPIIHRDLTPD